MILLIPSHWFQCCLLPTAALSNRWIQVTNRRRPLSVARISILCAANVGPLQTHNSFLFEGHSVSFMHNVKFDAVKDCHCGVEMLYIGCDYTFSDPALHQAIVKMQAEGKQESNNLIMLMRSPAVSRSIFPHPS